MARLSGAAVLLIVVVPLFMYTCALFVGIQLGRELERGPDSADVVSIRGVVEYFAKELWDGVERRRGSWDFVGRDARVLELVPASSRRLGRSSSTQPKHTYSRRPGFAGAGCTHQPNHTHAPRAMTYNRNHTSPRGALGVGSSHAVGGYGGRPFDMRGRRASRLHSITVYHSTVIHSMACEYSSVAARDGEGEGNRVTAGPWGLPHSYGSIGVRATINLSAGEHLTAVEGTSGKAPWNLPSSVVTSLTFRTSAGRTYGPYGCESGLRFSIAADKGSCIVGFRGRAGWLLDAIGVHRKPSCPSSRTDNHTYFRDQNLVRDG